MKKLPERNLPSSAVPWARSLEEVVAELEAERADLQSKLRLANESISQLAAQDKQQQNYIRVICQASGLPYPPVYTAPTPVPTPVPGIPVAPKLETKDFAATWSATWWQSFKRTSAGGTNDDRQSLYQRGSGYTFSMWRFDVGPARGRKITKAEMYLSNVSTYWNGQFTAFLGSHGSATEPGTRPGGRTNGFNIPWSAGEGKWFELPGWAPDGLSNGSIQGFTLGDSTAEQQNYARFNGVGRAGAPVLRLTYEV